MAQIGEKVAEHYNSLEERGLAERTKSRIFYLRNFNNWIKSMLIGDILLKVKEETKGPIKVLDIGCGKGGDLLKWKKGGITYLVCADIASTSVEQCQHRFQDMWRRQQFERRWGPKFEAEFLTADCTKERLRDLFKDPDIKFDVTSCQFAFHYCFESLKQVEQMLQNASESLRPGGYFIGTTPDSYEIIRRLKNSDDLSYGNDVYRVTFENKTDFALFGAKYNFHLEEVVDCPEFLVHFPVLIEIAKRHGLELVFKTHFDQFFSDQLKNSDSRNQSDGRQLLGKMQALETYPPFEGTDLTSKHEDDYKHAEERLKELSQDESNYHRRVKMGTLSQAEWEVTTLYVVFAFRKTQPAKKKRIHEAGDVAEPASKRSTE